MTQRFQISATPIAGLRLLRRTPVSDARGFLERLFCADELRDVLGDEGVVQVNRTLTRKRGTVRGLHFQHPPHAEIKLVTCLRGRVFDVAVDLRRDSPTFLRWHGEILDGGNHLALLIPKGFAHGFQVLESETEMLYFHTASYRPEAEGAVNADDPRIGISWPEPVTERSPRDLGHPLLGADYRGLVV